jgi:hypothetical protein
MSYTPSISQNIQLLSDRIESEVNRLSNDHQNEKYQTDSLVYIGNWQDAIPRSIWTDPSLSDIDVRSWGIIRTQAIQGSAVMLSLNNLLKDSRGYSNATVSRILYVLRLTRWISLCSTLRSESGTFRGNIYAIHDSPVSLDDAIYLDGDYLGFLKKQTAHKNNTIKTLAQSIWTVVSQAMETEDRFIADPLSEKTDQLNLLVNGKVSQTVDSLSKSNQVYFLNAVENNRVQKLNVAAKHQVQILNVVKEKNEIVENQSHNNHVQKLNVVCSSSSSSSSSFKNKDIKEKRTTTTNSAGISLDVEKNKEKQINRKNELQKDLIYPKEFNPNEIILSKKYLKLVEAEEQQNYLDELASKIKKQKNTSNPVGNNIALLAWLCKQHAEGNICLTSGYLNHQEQRKRKKKREQKIQEQQQDMTETALAGGNFKNTAVNGGENESIQSTAQEKKSTVSRWGGMNNALQPKHIVNEQ